MNRTELNPVNSLISKENLSSDAYQKLRNKAVAYQGVDENLIDDMISNAEQAVLEAQANFQASISDQVERAILIIKSDVGPESLAQENSQTLYNLIGVINADNPDPDQANQVVDEMAIKLSKIFNSVREEDLADDADFDDRFNSLEDRYGADPFNGLGDNQSRGDDQPDAWPDF